MTLRAGARLLLLAAALVVALWLLRQIIGVLLLFFAALTLAISLNAPVAWLERRRVPRLVGTLASVVVVVAATVALGALVVPRLVRDATALIQDLPGYARAIGERAAALTGDAPALQNALRPSAIRLGDAARWAPRLALGAMATSLSLLGGLVVRIVLATVVIFAVIDPRPLLRASLLVLPESARDDATRAFVRASQMVVGWMRANLIVGAVEAVVAYAVLRALGVPGALVWGVLALFAEFVPKLGGYIMAVPPTLVALSVAPRTAVWVALFYWALSEFMGDVVAPRVRAATMDLHPVFVLFVTLAMASAFGILGALIATPAAGFLSAYYDAFVASRRAGDPQLEARVDAMLARSLPPPAPGGA